MKRILTISQATKIRQTLNEKKVVLVGGCFDLLHIGHITFLEKAKKRGEVLMVFLESDESVRKWKGKSRPINSQPHRAKILESLRIVDYVILLPSLNSDSEYDELVIKLKPHILATTKGDKGIHHKKRQAQKIGAKVIEVTGLVPEKSTTALLQAISQDM